VGVVNGQRPSLIALIARLPPRIWLQAALGLIAEKGPAGFTVADAAR